MADYDLIKNYHYGNFYNGITDIYVKLQFRRTYIPNSSFDTLTCDLDVSVQPEEDYFNNTIQIVLKVDTESETSKTSTFNFFSEYTHDTARQTFQISRATTDFVYYTIKMDGINIAQDEIIIPSRGGDIVLMKASVGGVSDIIASVSESTAINSGWILKENIADLYLLQNLTISNMSLARNNTSTLRLIIPLLDIDVVIGVKINLNNYTFSLSYNYDSSGVRGQIRINFIENGPPAPSWVNVTSSNDYRYSSSNNITYSWGPVTGAEKYQVYVENVNNHSEKWDEYYPKNSSFSDYFTSPHIGKTFHFRVRAFRSTYGDWSDWSNSFQIKGFYVLKVSGTQDTTITALSFNPAEHTPTAPSGQQFDGWYTQAQGGEKIGSTIQLTPSKPSLTAWAHFTPINEGRITLNAGAGKFNNNESTMTVGLNSGGRWKVEKNGATRSGYTFMGYADSNNATTVQYKLNNTYTFTSGTIIYVVWQKNGTIIYDLNVPTCIDPSRTFTVTPSSIANGTKTPGTPYTISSVAPTITGFTFSGWIDSSGDTTVYGPGGSYTKDGGTTFSAIWKPEEFRYEYIQPSPGPAITITQETKKQAYNSFLHLDSETTTTEPDGTTWLPQEPLWKIKNGTTEQLANANSDYPFLFTNHDTKIQSIWKKQTGWKLATIWIYAPPEGYSANEIDNEEEPVEPAANLIIQEGE